MANSLYLDTNVYLSFYHLSNEDLDELKKLSVLTKSKKITLYLPEQTKNEFYRNRDSKIADAIKRFNENKLNNIFPQIIKDYDDEYLAMRDAIKSFDKNKQAILDKIKEDIKVKKLKADIVIEKLFANAKLIKTTPDLLEKSKMRFDLGNPPGKNNSYGDALNWESLLTSIDDFENFFFISDDKDYYSEYDINTFNSFLLKEWNTRMPLTNFRYYKTLSKFLKIHYPTINISTEQKKEQLINELANTNSFSETRRVLKELKLYDEFTIKQINDIIHAAISNTQVYWIGDDYDIAQYFKDLLANKTSKIEEDYLEDFKQKFPKVFTEKDILPF